MTTSTREHASRDAWVMTKPLPCAANADAEPHGGYAIISSAPAWLSRFGSTEPFAFSHSTLETSGRDDAVMTRNAVASSCDDSSPIREVTHPLASHHLGGARVRRPNCTFGYSVSALVGAFGRHCALAFGVGVAGARQHCPAGVGLESVPSLPVDDGLFLPRLELVRDPASEPVPSRVARQVGGDVASASQVARALRGYSVRVPDKGVGVQARERVVLT